MSHGFSFAKHWIGPLLLLGIGLEVRADEPETRDPLPSDAVSKRAIAAVDREFRREFSFATTTRTKRELALKLLQRGIACEQDAVARYAFLVEAQRMAKAAGDLDLYMEAACEQSETFAVDRWRLKCDALSAWPRKSASQLDSKLLATRLLGWIDEAVAAEQYSAAEELCGLLHTAADNSQDNRLIQRAAVRAKEVKSLTGPRLAKQPPPGLATSSGTDGYANLSGTWESSNEGIVVRLHDDGTTIRVELLKADKLARLDASFIRAGDRFIVRQWSGAFKPEFDSSGETRDCGAVVRTIDDEHLRVLTDKFWIDSGAITRKVRLGARYVWTKLGEVPSAER